jgi:hypothetical protein
LFGEEKPWEARFDNLYANVLREPHTGLYRCWYSPFIWMRPCVPSRGLNATASATAS